MDVKYQDVDKEIFVKEGHFQGGAEHPRPHNAAIILYPELGRNLLSCTVRVIHPCVSCISRDMFSKTMGKKARP